MATVDKNFKIKNGLVVEGSTATVDGNQVLTETASDQYIINLIGGETLITSVDPADFTVTDGELTIAAGSDIARDGDITSAINALDTDDIEEGATNQYFTNQRALDATSAAYDPAGSAATAQSNAEDYADGLAVNYDAAGSANTAEQNANTYTDTSINALTTDDIEEGTTNLYYSDTLARGAVSGANGINYNSANGEFSAHLGNGLEFSINGAIQIDENVVATETDLTNAISTHNASSGVHGVTGDIVGTTDTQTISNKTLGGDLAAGGFKITGLGSPDNSTDAATKGYVDAVSEGLHVHEAARVAIQGNISIATGLENGDTAGGVTLATGDRVLVKDQTNAAENGIYVVQASGQALRATDFDTATEIDSGDFIFVTSGTYANTGWVQTLKPATIGTDPLSFTQFSGAGTFTAGNGLTLDGTEFSIDETITATRTYVDTELDAHIDLTDNVHGVTGNVVGTSDSQTLTNKTLGSGTVLSANIDAVNTYTIENLEEPVNNQDAATKYYVDTEVSGVSGDLSTHEQATTGIHGVTGNIVGTSDSQTLTNKTISGSDNTLSNIGNASLTNSEVTINNNSVSLGSSITLDTDDIAEGSTNEYFTDARAAASAAALLTSANLTNITITGTGAGLTITAENGVADSTTDNLTEGTTNKYFTDQRAVDALEAVVPNFTAVEVNSLAKQFAATSTSLGSVVVTAYEWPKADYRSAKVLVKIDNGTHNEISEILLTLDSSDNVAITEYAIVGTNGSRGTITADVSGSNVRIRVNPVNDSTINVTGTLLA